MNLNKMIDHTYLKAFGTKKEIDVLLDEAKKYRFKSVCINPYYVKYAKELLEDSEVLVCTVIGFPLGANTVETKVFETLNAIQNGADEIDMVLNIGEVKSGNYDYILSEVNQVKKACSGKTLKVIIETCYLTESEIILVSETIAKSGANFIKTSTGFGPQGATFENVKLMKSHVGNKEVKAAGGVKTKEDVEKMIEAGATRIGTSNGVALVNNQTGSGY
ncbi:MAG: deoxyribose-phosphate aldolase [Candidatus Izemoplasmatales bacterium]|jgi:deoxyribose-phosphate aldolase|nr:deoxyribose-phosphate aldolase [Candidatus Izemoplasmatales bacterium]